MTKKQIHDLVTASYIKDMLDSAKVTKIASLLKRSDLKLYTRGLKLSEKARTITLVLPSLSLYNKSVIKTKREVRVVEDPSLLLGAKVIDNDMVYDMSLKNELDTFVQSI